MNSRPSVVIALVASFTILALAGGGYYVGDRIGNAAYNIALQRNEIEAARVTVAHESVEVEKMKAINSFLQKLPSLPDVHATPTPGTNKPSLEIPGGASVEKL